MWAICVAVATISAPPSDAAVRPSAPTAAVSPADYASPREWRERVRNALRREALTEGAEKEQAARDLLDLHKALEKDGALVESFRRGQQRRLQNRLRHVAQRIAAERGTPQVATVQARPGAPRFLAQQFGPANAPLAPNARQRGLPLDHGQDLLELIQQVIVPASWDVNGGPGTIYYYAPLRVLVIRQTSDVHGLVGGAVGQMRRGN